MKQLEIRLYKQHDFDLVLLHRSGKVNFTILIRNVLIAYINREICNVQIGTENRMLKEKAYYRIRLPMEETRDKEIILLMQSIESGKRGIFIKMLLRMTLGNASFEYAISVLQKQISIYNQENVHIKRQKKLPASNVGRKIRKEQECIYGNLKRPVSLGKKDSADNKEDKMIIDDEAELTQLFMNMFDT